MPAYLYILRLQSGQLYIGSTTDLEQLYKDHCSGKACRTTKYDHPSELVYSESFATFSEARKREAQIKRWTRPELAPRLSKGLSLLHLVQADMTASK